MGQLENPFQDCTSIKFVELLLISENRMERGFEF